MLAPEPFFQPRGTPISIFFRLKTLSDLGHKVDLVTYHLGENKEFPGLSILRIPNLFNIKKIKIGPSFIKIPLDLLLFIRAFWQVATKRYDLIFSHEEAAALGILLGRIFRIPHLYDMHSSLPQQLLNFDFTRSKTLVRLFKMMERSVLKNSRSILVICPDLERIVAAEGFGQKSFLLENFLDFTSSTIPEATTPP
ncbi:MAG: glycosyltransferase, partial [Candidatus Aminicenantes bacterium]|nr:glycosyltransferase [Candidatus Aminicenantes bacterium]